MPEVIADTSPVQYLHQTGLLHLLPDLYGKLILPRAVIDELDMGRALGVEVPDVHALSWIEIREVENLSYLRLSPDLGDGEKETLALGLDSADPLLILDDRLARRHAELLELRCTGTLGVLLEAKRQGRLPRIDAVLRKLEERGFRLSAATRQAVLRLAGESA